jgi:AraC-like DNA-binding protein
MDPLSDVLSPLKPRSYASGGFDMGGGLSIPFGQLAYLLLVQALRLHVAEGSMGGVGWPVGTSIALSLGYESENAFSTAFKRIMGRTPRQYGRDADRLETIAG